MHAGQDQADSSVSPSHTPLPPAPPITHSASPGAAPNEGKEQTPGALSAPDTASKPNLAPVLKSSRGHAPAKVGSPRSARQPGSPTDRKTRAGTLAGLQGNFVFGNLTNCMFSFSDLSLSDPPCSASGCYVLLAMGEMSTDVTQITLVGRDRSTLEHET